MEIPTEVKGIYEGLSDAVIESMEELRTTIEGSEDRAVGSGYLQGMLDAKRIMEQYYHGIENLD